MIDLRPVGHVIGLLVAVLGATMLIPMVVDAAYGNGHWPIFLQAAVMTVLGGGLTALATANSNTGRLSLQQTFLLTVAVWVALPLFGAIPFLMDPLHARPVDAFFEAMSGLTTTGSTVFSGLDRLPEGILLWRSMLQWFGGIGIIVMAMVFLPELRIGGMQIFRSEAFDTMGKILPRAAEIASQISWIYVSLTFACFLGYIALGLDNFDAVNHALTTLSTGGFSTRDASFGAFQGAPEYLASIFMILASLPFVRYIQLLAGTARPILLDVQVRGYLAVIAVTTMVLAFFQITADGRGIEESLREAVFNVTSIISGTGYASVDYQLWGAFAMVAFFFLGLVGGCAGSTCCSVKIFRYQIVLSAVAAQVRRINSPHGIFQPRFDGRPVAVDVLSSVMAFLVLFIVSLGVLSVLLGLTGLDFVTSLSGAATAIGNIGPGLGPVIGPAGFFGPLNDTAKWLLIAGMLVGRLELMAVYVLFTARFWRA
ncbi:Trk system potassium uptake protein TrkH [Oceaniovalibus guishaninsula JLT2003]|uniref:Trk system potassium uptake protein n=1 Tax=Oceaniovalibus guishaninsula JLT2003 TaxID=1231392 RepID=K2I5V6_9RHOB|nr:TrkH family potassium uptake protein [Oceaniovalibus guishaninsula]EKE44370.1 Trk system potassium uptake protein TrkH [Oceaniovalibus guishaninsula JLT2003]